VTLVTAKLAACICPHPDWLKRGRGQEGRRWDGKERTGNER